MKKKTLYRSIDEPWVMTGEPDELPEWVVTCVKEFPGCDALDGQVYEVRVRAGNETEAIHRANSGFRVMHDGLGHTKVQGVGWTAQPLGDANYYGTVACRITGS